MGWKNLFFETTEVPDKNPAPANNQTTEKANTSFTRRLPSLPSSDSTTSAPSYSTGSRPQVDNSKFVAHFDEVLEQTQAPNPNYYSFAKMLAEMGDLPDQAKFKAAFAALKVQGLTKPALVSTANTYLSALDQDNAGFKNAVQQQLLDNQKRIQEIQDTISQNTSEMDRIKKSTAEQIAKLQRDCDFQVEKLQRENTKNQDQIAPLEEESRTVNERVSIYNDACNRYKSIIQDDIQKIQNFIQ